MRKNLFCNLFCNAWAGLRLCAYFILFLFALLSSGCTWLYTDLRAVEGEAQKEAAVRMQTAVGDTEISADETETDEIEVYETEADESGVDETEADESEAIDDELSVSEDGHYTGKDEVALYIHTYGKLPSNFITKKKAQENGWDNRQNTLEQVMPGMSIGGDHFGNYEELLPSQKGRSYKECDIDYTQGSRNAKRIVYSNDGLIYYTEDHYNTFTLLYD